MQNHKKRIELAIQRFYEKDERKNRPSKRKNAKPEKEVEKDVLTWAFSRNWFLNVIESKAVFNKYAGRFIKGQAKKGHVDITGTTDEGLFVAIELKAPGRLSTLRHDQKLFLFDVIDRGGFGVCVDSSELLEKLWSEFREAENKKMFLKNLLNH